MNHAKKVTQARHAKFPLIMAGKWQQDFITDEAWTKIFFSFDPHRIYFRLNYGRCVAINKLIGFYGSAIAIYDQISIFDWVSQAINLLITVLSVNFLSNRTITIYQT